MPIVRLPGGELRDEIRVPLYDTIEITGAPNRVDQFFRSVTGKQRWQTNLRQNGQLDTAVSYRVQGMHMDAQSLFAAKAKALPYIMEYSSVRVHIGEKDYWEGPCVYLMGRIEQNAATGNAADFLYQRAGGQAVQGVILAGRHVVDINPLQSFFAELTIAVPAALVADATLTSPDAIQLKFSFKGLLRRPVQ